MSIRNTPDGYGLVAVAFHWTSAVAAVGMFASGVWMRTLGYGSPWYHSAPHYHKSVGLILAGLILGRLAWKGINQRPDPVGTPFEQTVSHLVHAGLYGLLATLFVSGYLIATGSGNAVEVFDLFSIPSVTKLGSAAETVGLVHRWSAYGLAALTVLHGAAALKHHFVDKDQVLVRMLGRKAT